MEACALKCTKSGHKQLPKSRRGTACITEAVLFFFPLKKKKKIWQAELQCFPCLLVLSQSHCLASTAFTSPQLPPNTHLYPTSPTADVLLPLAASWPYSSGSAAGTGSDPRPSSRDKPVLCCTLSLRLVVPMGEFEPHKAGPGWPRQTTRLGPTQQAMSLISQGHICTAREGRPREEELQKQNPED